MEAINEIVPRNSPGCVVSLSVSVTPLVWVVLVKVTAAVPWPARSESPTSTVTKLGIL